MKTSKLKNNPSNPRQIKGENLDRLKKSITEFKQMMELRPIIVDEAFQVLGGNMRLQAIRALKMKDIPDEWVKVANGLTEDQKREFIIKDNSSYGEYDWEILANLFDDLPLVEWAVPMDFIRRPEEGDWMEAFENTATENGDFNTVNMTFVIPKESAEQVKQVLARFGKDKNSAFVALIKNV